MNGLAKFVVTAIASSATFVALRVDARDQLLIDLKFVPAPKITARGIQGDTAMLSVPLNLVLVSNAAPGARETVGENQENKNHFVPIYAKGPVGPFVTQAVRGLLEGWGAHVSPDAKLQLEAEVVRFHVVETHRYHGDVKIRFILKNRNGEPLWEGLKVGATQRFGRSLSDTNYNETLSDSLATCVVSLVGDADFRAAWSGKPRVSEPVPAAAVIPSIPASGSDRPAGGLSPAEMKEKLVALQKEGFNDDLLVAFVRKTPLSAALTAEDMLDWKRSGLSQVVVKAALDAH